MPVAIDTSVLISAEKIGDFDALLPEDEEGPYYIPPLAAAEFLVGTRRRSARTCVNAPHSFTRADSGLWYPASRRRTRRNWPRSLPN